MDWQKAEAVIRRIETRLDMRLSDAGPPLVGLPMSNKEQGAYTARRRRRRR